MDLELRHLKVVCAIAEHGSVTRAAAHLGLAQPALTAQLNRIERALGGPLFERDHRGARPTALGELVLSRAKVVLPAVADLRHEAARLASTPVATIRYRIGSVGNSMVSGLMRRLSESRPDTSVTTQASWSALELTEQVAAACARAGFTPEPMYETDLRVCLDLVASGQAVALCQPTFREQPDVRGYPFAGAPLRWRHLLGWHPEAPADAVAPQVHEYAREAYRDSLRHSPHYAKWLARHPEFGA